MLEERDTIVVLRALVFRICHRAAVADTHREQLGSGARGGELDRIERNAVPQRAEERFAVG